MALSWTHHSFNVDTLRAQHICVKHGAMASQQTDRLQPRPKRAVETPRSTPRVDVAQQNKPSDADVSPRVELWQEKLEDDRRAFAQQFTEFRNMMDKMQCRIEVLEQIVASAAETTRGVTPEVSGPCVQQCQEDGDIGKNSTNSDGTPVAVADASDEAACELGESVWMAPVVMFGGALGTWSKVTISAGFLLNLIMQWCFCVVAFSSFGDSDLPDVSAAKRWRYGVGHSDFWSDPVTSASLVSRVCGGDDSLSFSTDQRDTVSTIAQYSQDLDLLVTTLPLTQGPILSMVASTLWSAVICADLASCIPLFLASVAVFHRGRRDGFLGTVTRCGENGWQLIALSPLHMFAMCCIVALRVSVALVLMFVGIRWILSTTSIENIILNCAALGFVIDVDEVLFASVLTSRVQHAVRTMQPLSLRSFRIEGSLRPCVVYVAIVIVVVLAVPSCISTLDLMEDLRHIMCDGRQDFVFVEMPATTWIALNLVTAFSESELTFPYYALEEAVWAASIDTLTFSYDTSGDALFGFASSAGTEKVSEVWGSCVDNYFVNSAVETLFAWSLDVQDAECADPAVPAACESTVYPHVRFSCPVTCGCREARSYLWLNGIYFGCSSECSLTDEYLESMHSITCTPTTVAELQETGDWNRLVQNYLSSGEELGLDRSDSALGLLEQGCGYVTGREQEFCIETGEHRSLIRWCPVECGCRAPRFADQEGWLPSQCPPQCTAWRTRFWAQMMQLPCTDSGATEFSEPSSAAATLTQHLETFQHVFTDVLTELVTTNLSMHGCDFFTSPLHSAWCNLPYYMTAVCPVACGCLTSPDKFACPVSCAAGNTIDNATER